jgi:two-component system nitrogen regulation response regulator GlnG/two-component system response regulator HydG
MGKTGSAYLLGRGEAAPDDTHPRLLPQEQRAGGSSRAAPLKSPRISRAQLLIETTDEGLLAITNLGKARMLQDGFATQRAVLGPGQTLQLGSQLLLLCVRRHAWSRTMPAGFPLQPFGRPDANGIVGESPAIGDLRQQVEFAAKQSEHVLVTGESGTGKELIAAALHRGSSRADQVLLSRNASTFPETLIDAELFGNAKNYPNPGTPERHGLFGEAHGATLFLDEIAELPALLQTHLLRVLDHGEYQRLGDASVRRVDVRLIGATNRPGDLRADLAARFKLRIRAPGIDERREDIPLLAHFVVRSLAARASAGALRFFPSRDPNNEPRVSLALMSTLVQRRYVAHFRELEALLWQSVTQSPGDTLEAPAELANVPVERARLDSSFPESEAIDPGTISAEALERALLERDWVIEQTWRDLNLSSRHVLTRLIAKHGLKRR